MGQRKPQRTAVILAAFVMVLLTLVLPSWSFSESPKTSSGSIRDRLNLNKTRDPDRFKEFMPVPPKEKEERGIFNTLYKVFILWPALRNIQTADQIAGVKDNPGDRGYSGTGYEHLPFQKSYTPPLEFGTPEGRKRMDALRARAAANRAKKDLKNARELAQEEKKKADAQAAQASLEQQSEGCFPRDIQVVMADGTSRSIADVKAGDVVLTYDIGYDQIVGKPVLETYFVKSNHLYTINDEFKATGSERVLTQSGWRALSALTQQDRVHINGRMIDIDKIAYQRMELPTYNLQVDDTHNFFVQTESGNTLLVHNCGGGGAK